MNTSLRAVLAVGLLAGFYVLVGAVLAALVAVNVFAFQNMAGLALKLLIISMLAAWALLRGVFAVNRRAGAEPEPGVPVTPAEEPRLWATVRELAERVGTRPPDELWLVPDVNAAVGEDGRWLGLRSGTRRMFVGLPLLATLTADEARAVLAHELGHFSGRHTRLGGIAYRGRLAIERTVEHLDDRPVVRCLFTGYGRLYLRTSMAVARRQELEADAMMVAVAGREAASRALREVSVTVTAWEFFLDSYVGLGWKAGCVPEDLFGGFRALVADPDRQDELAAVRESPPQDERDPYDSHPTLAQRLDAISRLPDPEIPHDGSPALTLLADPDRTCQAVAEIMLGADHGRDPLPWHALVARAATVNAADAAGTLLRAAERTLATAPARLGHVLDLLAAGRADDLAGYLVNAGPDADPDRVRRAGRQVLAFTLEQLVATALTERGLAAWQLSWSTSCRLVDVAGVELRLFERIETALADPARVLELRQYLDLLGVPVDYVAGRGAGRGAKAS